MARGVQKEARDGKEGGGACREEERAQQQLLRVIVARVHALTSFGLALANNGNLKRLPAKIIYVHVN